MVMFVRPNKKSAKRWHHQLWILSTKSQQWKHFLAFHGISTCPRSNGDQQKCPRSHRRLWGHASTFGFSSCGLGPGHFRHTSSIWTLQYWTFSLGTMIDGVSRSIRHVCIDNNSQLYNWVVWCLNISFIETGFHDNLRTLCIIRKMLYPSWLPWGQQNDTHEPLQNQGTHTWIVAVPARLVPRFQTLWRRCRHHGKYPSSEKHLVIFFRRSVVFFRKRFLGRSFWWKSEKKKLKTHQPMSNHYPQDINM